MGDNQETPPPWLVTIDTTKALTVGLLPTGHLAVVLCHLMDRDQMREMVKHLSEELEKSECAATPP